MKVKPLEPTFAQVAVLAAKKCSTTTPTRGKSRARTRGIREGMDIKGSFTIKGKWPYDVACSFSINNEGLSAIALSRSAYYAQGEQTLVQATPSCIS